MAFSSVNPPDAVPHYICKSTDVKTVTSITEGSRAYEADTRRWYVFHANEWWLAMEESPVSVRDLEALIGEAIGELRKLRSGSEMTVGSELQDPED